MKIIMRRVFMIFYPENHENDNAKGGVVLIKLYSFIRKQYQNNKEKAHPFGCALGVCNYSATEMAVMWGLTP
ncbi:MAG: hypothetical protein ACI4PH_06925, partial [Faecousia sp.]